MIKGIVCVAKDWGIGKANGLLFNLPSDMKYFKETTKHNIIVMGYSTYLSIGRPLPSRVNIILWDNATSLDCIPGCITFNNFKAMLNFIQILSKEYDVFICGGASIYRLFLPYYDEILVTHVDTIDPEATVFFPDLSKETVYYKDKLIVSIKENNYNLEFWRYKRIPQGEK